MNSRTKMTLIMTTMVIISIVSIVAIIAIFAANVQTFNSNVSVTYRCEEVTGSASAKYYVGSDDKTGTSMRVGGGVTGDTIITFEATDPNKNTSLSPVEKNIKLSKDKDYIVFEYYFTNGPATTDYNIDLFFEGTLKNVNIFFDVTEEQISDHSLINDDNISIINQGTSQTFSFGVTVPHKEDGDKIGRKYIYFKVAINDKGKDAAFSGNFTFDLKLKQPYEGVTTNSIYLGSAQAYLNSNNIEIVATPVSAVGAKVVGVKNKATGKWVAVDFSSSSTKFIINETSGEYEVVFNKDQDMVTSGNVDYTLLTNAQVAFVRSLSQISLAAVIEPTETTKVVEVKEYITSYEVIGISDSAITQGGIILNLPDSIIYADRSAINLSNDELIGIQASEAVLNKINAPFKINLKNNLNLTHYASSISLDNGTWCELSYDYNVVLSTSSNSNCFTLQFKGNLDPNHSTGDFIVQKQTNIVLLGKNANANYNLKVSNDVTFNFLTASGVGKGLERMTESESIKVGGKSLYTTEGGTKSHLSDINPDINRNFDNAVQTSKDIDISFVYTYATESAPCFIEGSLITLANGKAKPVEEITYDDLLLVWDFDTGRYAASYPVWITKTLKTEEYYKITFDDGSVFYNVVAHRIYSTDTNYFEKSVDATNSQIGHNFFAVNTDENGDAIRDADGNITFKSKRIVDIEVILEHKEYYNLITGYTMNVFVNSILASTGMSNLYGATPGMKYDPEKVAERQKDIYEFDELNVPAHYYYGLRLGEQKTVREIPDINKYVELDIPVAREVEQVVENGVSYNNWIVSTSDDDVFSPTFKPNKVREGGTYTLAQPKNAANFVGWYCSADGKIYHAGDSVTIRMGTYFTAIYSN